MRPSSTNLIVAILVGYVATSADSSLEESVSTPIYPGLDPSSPCYLFSYGNPDRMEFYSPNYPNTYPNNSDCIKIIEGPVGSYLRLDFRDSFNVEPSGECRFDYLEVRDGAHGYSGLLGTFCGRDFPPIIESTGRFLWLRFRSDESIEYTGFRAVYKPVPKPTSEVVPEIDLCRFEVSGEEGYVNRTDIDSDLVKESQDHGLPLDCMWIIKVDQGLRIQLAFLKFQLAVPNDCEENFIDVYAEATDLQSRLHNFCGSIAEMVQSPENVLKIRFVARPSALTSNFEALYTAFRDRPKGSACESNEYDCEDATCISMNLKCNGRINCRFRWDEDPNQCTLKQGVLSAILNTEHMIIIIIVFFLILTGMCCAFLFNCFRKLIRDHRIIQEHMRECRLSQLEGGKWKYGGRGEGANMECPPTPPEEEGGASEEEGVESDEETDGIPEMVDSVCQTKESLFQCPSSDPSSSEPSSRGRSLESTKSAPDVIMSH